MIERLDLYENPWASVNDEKIKGKINELVDKVNTLDKQNADGCEGCKYQSKDEFEMPCLNCKRNKMDYWRAE